MTAKKPAPRPAPKQAPKPAPKADPKRARRMVSDSKEVTFKNGKMHIR